MTAAAKLRWYVHRVRAMSPAEVGHRFAEKYKHATQQSYIRKISSIAWNHAPAAFPELPDRLSAPPSLLAQLRADADALRQGRWQLFGWQGADVKTPPAWHRDPIADVVIDSTLSAHRLDHRHLPGGADVRRIWEINRWAELTRLAMHGWLNRDVPAIQLAQRWLEDWCGENPVGRGINWTSPLEAALRLLNFCWIDALARAGAPETGAVQDALTAQIVPLHAGWIWRHRSVGSSANNHLLGELAALTAASARWPGLEQVACATTAAWDNLGAEILRQFAPDGGSREQALHYHLFGWDLAWQAARAAHCHQGAVHERLGQAARFFMDMAVSGEAWDFGDSDDAQVLPFALCRSDAGSEWKAWLQGQPGALRFWLGEPPVVPSTPSQSWRCYSETGMAMHEAPGWRVRFDASPLGFGALAAHGHCDALHVSVWDHSEALLIDPGTGGYFAAPEVRARLAGWDAHNGPQPLQAFRSPERIGTFLQTRHHSAPSLAMDGGAAIATFSHEGHSFSRSTAVHGDRLEISDVELSGRPFRTAWQFAPGCTLTPMDPSSPSCWIIAKGPRRWLMRFAGESPTFAVSERLVSPAYGQMKAAPALSITSRGAIRTILERHG
ncbi:MAG TPA: heparinase II/III family protein [Prosthecobacter sp.]|nr:heparinase II/III family protein [Prosthecobacter sp.]